MHLKSKQISVFLLGLGLIFMLLNSTSVHATTVEPKLTIKGTIVKDIIDFNDIWLYTDESGSNRTLKYTIDGNISFSAANIKFKTMFENVTINKGTDATGTGVAYEKYYLVDSNDIPYLLLYIKNTTATNAYWAYTKLAVDKTFDPDSYIIIGFKILFSEISNPYVSLRLVTLDIGGEDHYIVFSAQNSSTESEAVSLFDSTLDSDSQVDDISITLKRNFNNYVVFQFKLQDLLTAAGLNTEITKLEYIMYGVGAVSATSLGEGDNEVKGIIRYAFLSTLKVTINDVPLNGTTIELASDKISINRDVEKIADVSIPFTYTVEAEKSYDADTLSIKYDYLFSLPSDSALSFSGVTANFTLNDFKSPDANLSYFYVSGTDYSDTLESQGYYSWSVSAGVQYYVTAKFEVSEEIFDTLVEIDVPPAFWSAPLDYIQYYFWHIVLLIGSALSAIGIGKGIANTAKKKKRAIKAKTKSH